MSIFIVIVIAAIVIFIIVKIEIENVMNSISDLFLEKDTKDSGRKKEIEIFGNVRRRKLPAKQKASNYEKPLDIIPAAQNNQVLPPPEPVQGINNGNEII